VARAAIIGMVVALVAASTATASRLATRSEENILEVAFLNAHKRDDGYHLKSIKQIRVSVVDDRWAAVVHKKPKRASKKAALDFFRLKGSGKWKHKRKAPKAVAKDLKQKPEPFVVDIRYQASGDFHYAYDYADKLGDTQNEHGDADFGWDFEWDGVELYDTHYPGGDDTPNRADADGDWIYSYADNFNGSPDCSASGQLQPAFTGRVITERGSKGKVNVMFEFPNYTAATGCIREDFWDLVLVSPEFQVVRDVPTFPSAPVERPVSESFDCSKPQVDATEVCSFAYSGTVTITP
jgi:hypothetical protein